MAVALVGRFDSSRHDVAAFRCGEPETDRWLRLEAAGGGRKPGGVVYVAALDQRVVGCYRLGAFALETSSAATVGSDGGLSMPALLVSRLGVDQRWQGRGLGAALVWNALDLAARMAPDLEARLVLARAESPAATGFGSRLGFHALTGDSRFCWVSIRDVQATRLAGTIPPATASPHSTGQPR